MEDVEMAQPAEKDGEAERQAGGSGNDGSLWADFTEMEESKVSVREKMKRIKGFKKFVEKSVEMVESVKKALGDTALTSRKQDMILAPVVKYCVELRERCEEVRCDGWQKNVLKLMKERGVETVQELREECEKLEENNEEEGKIELENENETLKSTNKCLQRLLEDKNLELAEELDRSAAEVETMRKKVKEAEKLVEKLKKAMVKEKAVSGGLKGSIGHLEKKLAKAQGDRKAADGRLGEFERWIELFRKEEKEECGCQKGKAHYVEALGGECHDPKSLALSTLARNEKIASEDVNLMKCEEDFRKKLGKSERLEALRKFAGICPTWASKIMRNDWTEEELEWREAAESLKKEVMYRNQPQKAIIQEKYILVGQRMGLKSKAVFEMRTATISTWKQKFGWEKVEKAVVLVEWTKDDKQLKALVNLVEEIAKEVWELVVVPARMECGYDEVGGVTETWQKVRKTALNVEVVDLMTPVGPKKMPLILCDLKPGSLEKMMEYLACAIPGHSLVDRLRADVEDSEPKIKKHRAN
ncbi:hypothetical protein L5515_015305 [Caenorhabditis briggsae]|uniref:Uncharacterized protein n=2 Tax=Caenorhabditis briggsae TaxID=6238 RepID=A0AAE9EEE7_CAEBR|nr:hypothetical protein L5515_015305 [Caenorhabditis briggsae]